MTTEDIIAKIKLKIDDEAEDYKEYMKLSDECQEHNMCEMASIIKDIAHEELTHMEHLMLASKNW